MIIDTHCHLIDDTFQGDVDEVVIRAIESGVKKMILACCDEDEFEDILLLSNKYPEHLFPTVGIHPENIKDNVQKQFETIRQKALRHPEIKAIGEIGIDLHWDKSRLADQLWLLTAQTDWATDLDLPLLLHIRDAMPEFLTQCRDTLFDRTKAKGKRLSGILHCYSGTPEQAEEALDYGDFYFGIGGTVTYKKSLVPEVVKRIGLERIVLETDAPYLAPMPHRGKRNEPAYTAITAKYVADILGISYEKVASQTTENAIRLFGF